MKLLYLYFFIIIVLIIIIYFLGPCQRFKNKERFYNVVSDTLTNDMISQMQYTPIGVITNVTCTLWGSHRGQKERDRAARILKYQNNRAKCKKMSNLAYKSLVRFEYDLNCKKYFNLIKKFNH